MYWFTTTLFQVPSNDITLTTFRQGFLQYVWITCVSNFTVTFHFRHCDIFFIMSQLRCQCFYYNNILLIALNNISFWYVQVINRLFLGLSLWDTFSMWQLNFNRFLKNSFLIILEIRYLLGCSKYVRKYGTVTLRIGS